MRKVNVIILAGFLLHSVPVVALLTALFSPEKN